MNKTIFEANRESGHVYINREQVAKNLPKQPEKPLCSLGPNFCCDAPKVRYYASSKACQRLLTKSSLSSDTNKNR